MFKYTYTYIYLMCYYFLLTSLLQDELLNVNFEKKKPKSI